MRKSWLKHGTSLLNLRIATPCCVPVPEERNRSSAKGQLLYFFAHEVFWCYAFSAFTYTAGRVTIKNTIQADSKLDMMCSILSFCSHLHTTRTSFLLRHKVIAAALWAELQRPEDVALVIMKYSASHPPSENSEGYVPNPHTCTWNKDKPFNVRIKWKSIDISIGPYRYKI